MTNQFSIKVLQPNGLELIYLADEIQWNSTTKTITVKTDKVRRQIALGAGQRAFVMNQRGSTISIYRG